MNALLSAKQTGMLLKCSPNRVMQRMKRGYWDIGIVVPPKNKKGNCTYEVSPRKLAEHFGVPMEEVFRALEEKRPLRIFEKGGTGVNAREEIPITEEVMRYAKEHMEKEKPWMHGKPVKAYLEKDKRISITYEDSCWWFYRDVDGEVVWE